MEELWKPIIGYEGLYEVSNIGNVRSLNFNKTGNIKILKGLKSKTGHCRVFLYGNRKCNQLLIHRLVAIHFIPNPNNLPLVCHKDETLDENGMLYNGENNLFWGTHKDNSQDMLKKGRGKYLFKINHPCKGKLGKDSKNAKKVNQYTLDGEFIREWGSIIEIDKELGINKSSIGKCCIGKLKTSGNFIWKFKL